MCSDIASASYTASTSYTSERPSGAGPCISREPNTERIRSVSWSDLTPRDKPNPEARCKRPYHSGIEERYLRALTRMCENKCDFRPSITLRRCACCLCRNTYTSTHTNRPLTIQQMFFALPVAEPLIKLKCPKCDGKINIQIAFD